MRLALLTAGRTVRCLAVAALALAARPIAAQTSYAIENGRVEVVGLRTWTLRQLRDSIARRMPGESLESAACMVILRDSLHFADAFVLRRIMQLRPDQPAHEDLIIKVIEPRDRARVRWAAAPADSFTSLLPAYAPVVLPVTDSTGGLWMGRLEWPFQYYAGDGARRAAALAGQPRAREDAERLWGFLEAHRSEADRRTAMTTLRTDGFRVNRLVAAAVLANFGGQDSTWYALVEALRDPNESVRSLAAQSLGMLPSRRIDWAPAAPTLRLLLGGTNVSASEEVMTLLARTEVSPSLARTLLRGNGAWVRAHLRAEYDGGNRTARTLLTRLNGGHDLGASEAVWGAWLRAL